MIELIGLIGFLLFVAVILLYVIYYFPVIKTQNLDELEHQDDKLEKLASRDTDIVVGPKVSEDTQRLISERLRTGRCVFLARRLLAIEDIGETSNKTFSPYTTADSRCATITTYLADEIYYSERIDEHLTIFWTNSTPKEIVGYRLKGVMPAKPSFNECEKTS